jgi:S-adenosylmethionine:tRNA ribosyltransferase-isomerase
MDFSANTSPQPAHKGTKSLQTLTYELPAELIALYPPEVRGTSRLLVLDRKSGRMEHRAYTDLPEFLRPGDCLVLNDTKVMRARLFARDSSGDTHELLVLERHSMGETDDAFRAVYKGPLKAGTDLFVSDATLRVEKIEGGGIATLRTNAPLKEIMEAAGHVPIPPYLKRPDEPIDIERYQTVFSQRTGSVAAPTASLNITDEMLETMSRKGITIAYLTLHVGAGTFLPIRTDNPEDHVMHSEYFVIPAQTTALIKNTRASGGRIIAAGTTVARTLEFAHKRIEEETGEIAGEADIFIYPGYAFKVVDVLLTNFHAPRSTVLMLAAAFAGQDALLGAYHEAMTRKYRFLSYGDSMLIL